MSRAKLMTDAIDAFVVGCKADGIWDAIKACCILAGWDGLAGALTPIKGSAPTNNNFVSADYNRKMGLVGNGTTKFLNSNRANNADPQDSKHLAIYISAFSTIGGSKYAGSGGTNPTAIDASTPPELNALGRVNCGTNAVVSSPTVGFCGVNRSSASLQTLRSRGVNGTTNTASGTPTADTIGMYGRFAGDSFTGNARLAFYSLGESLDLALLDSRVSTLLTSIWRAAHPEFTVVTNPDAMDWIGRVYDAGGSVSVSTANAVNTFCNSIDAAGIRSKFLRLNLFAGNDLTSALVPLYRSSAYGGAVVGNATDTNNNFVSADYVETGASGGLKGNGTTKYLATGVAPNAIASAASMHLSAYIVTANTSAGAAAALGQFAGGGLSELALRHRPASGTAGAFYAVFNDAASFVQPGLSNNPTGHVVGANIASNDLRMFLNGSQVGSPSTNTATSTRSANGIFVFAVNWTSASFFSDQRIGAYSVGDGLTTSDASAFYLAIQAFQAALQRNV